MKGQREIIHVPAWILPPGMGTRLPPSEFISIDNYYSHRFVTISKISCFVENKSSFSLCFVENNRSKLAFVPPRFRGNREPYIVSDWSTRSMRMQEFPGTSSQRNHWKYMSRWFRMIYWLFSFRILKRTKWNKTFPNVSRSYIEMAFTKRVWSKSGITARRKYISKKLSRGTGNPSPRSTSLASTQNNY